MNARMFSLVIVTIVFAMCQACSLHDVYNALGPTSPYDTKEGNLRLRCTEFAYHSKYTQNSGKSPDERRKIYDDCMAGL